MITLEQVLLLDEKIQKAVDTITDLRNENAGLKSKLTEYQTRIEELEVLIKDFKDDQGEIEEGILKALKQLDTIDSTETPASEAPTEQERAVSSASTEDSDPAPTSSYEQELDTSVDTGAVSDEGTDEVANAVSDEVADANSDVDAETVTEGDSTEQADESDNADEGAVELDIF